MSDLSFLKEIPDPLTGSDPPRMPVAPRVRHRAPVRRDTSRRRALALGLSLGWLAAHLAVFGVRPDFARLPGTYVAAQIVVPALLGAASLLLALAPGRLGLGVRASAVSGVAVMGPLLFWLLGAGIPAPYAAERSRFWLGSLVCLDITLAWAAAPLLLAGLTLKHAFASRAGWRSALVGAALGLLAGAAINLHCPNVDPAHLIVGHGIPIVLATLVGGLALSRWARA